MEKGLKCRGARLTRRLPAAAQPRGHRASLPRDTRSRADGQDRPREGLQEPTLASRGRTPLNTPATLVGQRTGRGRCQLAAQNQSVNNTQKAPLNPSLRRAARQQGPGSLPGRDGCAPGGLTPRARPQEMLEPGLRCTATRPGTPAKPAALPLTGFVRTRPMPTVTRTKS